MARMNLWASMVLALSAAAPLAPPAVAAPAAPALQDRLGEAASFLHAATKRRQYLGVVALVLQDGKVVLRASYGWRDLARTERLQADDIFRVYSMTKAVTAVAVLTLVEEGKLRLDDPVGTYLPEFAQPQVFVGDVNAPATRPARAPLTIRALLSHTAGFASGYERHTEVARRFNGADLEHAPDLAAYAARAARVPLAADPGTQFHYDGVPSEVAARIVEVVSGQRFDRFLQRRIFDPLRMADTGFEVAPAQRGRIAQLTTSTPSGELAPMPVDEAAAPGARLFPYLCASGGLYSTAPDYARFAQMLLNGGELDGARILTPASVREMMRNQLAHLDPPTNEFSTTDGFGLGGAVVLDAPPSTAGAFHWGGAAGTHYLIDPRRRLVLVLMTQYVRPNLPADPPALADGFYTRVYDALPDRPAPR